jgi:hypothetical protein
MKADVDEVARRDRHHSPREQCVALRVHRIEGIKIENDQGPEWQQHLHQHVD